MGKVKIYKLDPRIARIIATVSRLTDVPISKIRGKRKTNEIVTARRIAMVLIHSLQDADGNNDYTLTTIGSAFKKDHATVYHALKKHQDFMDTDPGYSDFFSICATTIGIDKISDSKTKDDIIAKLAQRVDYLEQENAEYEKLLTDIKEML